MERFVEAVADKLKRAGWFAGRNVGESVLDWKRKLELSDRFEMFTKAEQVLLEFGGITVRQEGPGRTCAREPFVLIPTLATGERDRFDEFSEHLGTKLYPLGEACGGTYYLAVSETGQVFFLMNHIRLLGEDIDEALQNLIQGINANEVIWTQAETADDYTPRGEV